MAGSYLPYYEAVAARILPFLTGRKVAVEQRFRDATAPVFRRHEGRGGSRTWIHFRSEADVVDWARRHAVAFHAHLKPDGPGCWFLLDIDSRQLDLAMGQVAAIHALDVVQEQGLQTLVKFSGADGFHLMWNMPNLAGLGGGDVWTLERRVVVAIAREVERRLDADPRAAPIRDAVGPARPLIATSSQDAENAGALLFDEHILKPNVNARAPYSIHARSGLVAVPLTPSELTDFDPALAAPDLVATSDRAAEMPDNDVTAVKRALATWTAGSQGDRP